MSNKLHVAIFLPSLRGGGAERAFVVLANQLVLLGYSVDLLLVKAEGVYLEEVNSKVKIYDFASSRSLLALPKLIAYLRRQHPPILLSALTHINVLSILSSLFCKKTKTIISERSNLSRSLDRLGRARKKLLQFLIRISYFFADHIVAVSKGVGDDLIINHGFERDKISVIPNPYDIEKIKKKSLVNIDPKPWLTDDVKLILAVGRLTEAKDYPTLLKAMKLVTEEYSNAHLLILGEGEEKDYLKKIILKLDIESNVHLGGFDINPFRWMRKSDVYVLSSKQEGFPNVLVQALICGSQIVSTDCDSGPNEILEHGRWGALVDVGNYEELAGALIDILKGNKIYSDGSERAYDYSAEKITKCYSKLFMQILKER